MTNSTRWASPDDNPPNLLLAIDPGAAIATKGGAKVPYCGAALFQWGSLVWAGLVKSSSAVTPFQRPRDLVERTITASGVWMCEHSLGEPLDMLAVEFPRIYKKMKTPPEDIVQLTLIAGAFAGGIKAKRYSLPRPSEWKGTIDGEILLNRVVGKQGPERWEGGVLNNGERLVLIKAEGGKTSHVRDAVALGCWVTGRVDVGGVF